MHRWYLHWLTCHAGRLQAEYRRHRGLRAGAPVSMQQLRELVDLAGQVSEDVPGHSPVTREHLAARTRRGPAHRRWI